MLTPLTKAPRGIKAFPWGLHVGNFKTTSSIIKLIRKEVKMKKSIY